MGRTLYEYSRICGAIFNLLRRYHLHFHLKRRYDQIRARGLYRIHGPPQIPTSPLFQSSSSFRNGINCPCSKYLDSATCVLRKYTLYFNIRGSSRVSPWWRRRRIPVPNVTFVYGHTFKLSSETFTHRSRCGRICIEDLGVLSRRFFWIRTGEGSTLWSSPSRGY